MSVLLGMSLLPVLQVRHYIVQQLERTHCGPGGAICGRARATARLTPLLLFCIVARRNCFRGQLARRATASDFKKIRRRNPNLIFFWRGFFAKVSLASTMVSSNRDAQFTVIERSLCSHRKTTFS